MSFEKKIIYWICILIAFLFLGLRIYKRYNFSTYHTVGQEIDSFNGIPVYYNAWFTNTKGRNITNDGYNLGLKFQCIEFVKRYYYERLNHKMPNSYGHAKDFFDKSLLDGQKNKARNLFQYTNASRSRPKVGDILIYKASIFNKFGHVSIVSKVADNEIEVIQQNVGTMSRQTFKLVYNGALWKIKSSRILGWLRKANIK